METIDDATEARTPFVPRPLSDLVDLPGDGAGGAARLDLRRLPAAIDSLSWGSPNIPIAIGLHLMMYPPLARVRYEDMTRVFEDQTVLAISMIHNLPITPAL